MVANTGTAKSGEITAQSYYGTGATATRKKSLLEVVDASGWGILRAIWTKLFWAAFPTALSGSAEFNVLL
jgi:hypothetical protein